MQSIPDDILERFNAAMEQKSVPVAVRDDYRKWLKYYLDFRIKYPPPDKKSEQVRLFIDKMRSKGKTGKDLYHALQANYDIRTIQTLLGHSDIRTTMIYTHCVPSKTIKEIASPLDF
jgi:integrase